MRVLVLVFVLFHLPGMAGVFEVRFKEPLGRGWFTPLIDHMSGVRVIQRPYISENDLNQLDARVVKTLADCILLNMTEASAAVLRNSRPNFNVRLLY